MIAAGTLVVSVPRTLATQSSYPTDLSEFENDFTTAAIAIDLLWGGNVNDPTGINHVIVDAYTSGKSQPHIGPPELKNLFLEKGPRVNDSDLLKRFLQYNVVETRLDRIEEYANNLEDRWRKTYIKNVVAVLRVHLNLRKSMVGLCSAPPKEMVYRKAFGRDPYFIETSEKREILRQRLAAVGLETSTSKSLIDIVELWRQRAVLDAHGIEQKWKPFSEEMNRLTRERILPYLPDYAASIPEDVVDFAIIWDNVSFSGLNLAQHTIDSHGNPIYKTIVRMSSAITKSEPEYKLHLVAHEGRPGHGLHLPLLHLLYAKGIYGFETTLFILNSASGLLAEGIASATAYLLYGGDLEGHLSPDELVAVAKSDLEVAGRNNVVIKAIQGERNPDTLKKFLRDEFAFSPNAATRCTRWLAHPLFGTMYLPAYGIGAEMIQAAVRTYGREKVIPVAYGTQGQIDGITFQDRMALFGNTG
jgi:hypothetical protein